MIARVTGRLCEVVENAAYIELGGLCYEIMTPATASGELSASIGREVTLHTLHFVEGNPALGPLTPRLLGFVRAADRAFFLELTRVRGISSRKALRAMSIDTPHFARAIESGDLAALSALPEIGKKTAAQLVADLRGRLESFLTDAPPTVSETPLTGAQQMAVEILVKWGDRRPDAQRWVAAAVAEDAGLTGADEIVRAAYAWKGRS